MISIEHDDPRCPVDAGGTFGCTMGEIYGPCEWNGDEGERCLGTCRFVEGCPCCRHAET